MATSTTPEKLTVHENRLHFDGGEIFVATRSHPKYRHRAAENAAELAQRWNAHSDMVALLRLIIDNASKSTTSGELLVAEHLIERAREIVGDVE